MVAGEDADGLLEDAILALEPRDLCRIVDLQRCRSPRIHAGAMVRATGDLAGALGRCTPALVYAMPALRNPTGSSLSPLERTRLIRSAGDVPLVADASSTILSRPLDVSRYGVVYAGAQKNLGPSGVVLVIIRNDLVEVGSKDLPTMLQYRTYAKENSMYNTPNTFGIYVMGEVFKWIKAEGGLKAMAEHNEAKAKVLYDYLDQSRMFKARALPGSRSRLR